jgi:hypothetical protein
MIRYACFLALVLVTAPSDCYAQAAPAEPTAPEDKAATCNPQPQCRAQFTILKPSKEHHALRAAAKKKRALALGEKM